MGLLTIIVILIVVFGLLLVIKRSNTQVISKSWPVSAKKLMDKNEQIVFYRLTEALPDNLVLAQVAMSQMITVRGGKESQWARNKIYKKVADFVICRPDMSIEAVIELDGSSHDSKHRSKSDADKEAALNAAGLQLIRLNTKELPNGPQIRALLGKPLEL
ncbi:MAG: DUF2726 domain-containing protein [Pseudomonadota bacterium]